MDFVKVEIRSQQQGPHVGLDRRLGMRRLSNETIDDHNDGVVSYQACHALRVSAEWDAEAGSCTSARRDWRTAVGLPRGEDSFPAGRQGPARPSDHKVVPELGLLGSGLAGAAGSAAAGVGSSLLHAIGRQRVEQLADHGVVLAEGVEVEGLGHLVWADIERLV